MSGRRAEIQRQLAEAHINEVKELICELQDAIVVSEVCMKGTVTIPASTMNKVVRNLRDLQKRFLEGTI